MTGSDKKIYYSSLIYIISGVFNSFSSLLLGLYLAKISTSYEFGQISLLQSALVILVQLILLNSLGYVPVCYGKGNDYELNRYKSLIYSISPKIGFVLFVIFSAASVQTAIDAKSLCLFFLYTLLYSLNEVDNSEKISRSMSVQYGAAILISRLTSVLGVLVCDYLSYFSIEIYLLILIFSEIGSLIYRGYFENLLKSIFIINVDFDMLRSILVYGIKYLPLVIFGWLYQYSDRVFVNYYLTMDELGRYSFAVLLSSSVSILSNSMVNSIIPLVYKSESNDLSGSIKKAAIYNFFASIAGLFFVAYFSTDIALLLGKNIYSNLTLEVFLLGLGFSFQGLYKIYVSILDSRMMYIKKLIIFIFSSACGVAVNILLVPDYHLVGASISFLISGALLFLSTILVIKLAASKS